MLTTMQRVAIGGATMGLSLSVAFAAVATSISPPPAQGSLSIGSRGHVQLRGTVSKVDATAKTIGVKVWGTEWTVKVDDATKFQPAAWRKEAFTFAEIAVGHSVSVTGTTDGTAALTVSAKRIVDYSVRPKPVIGYAGKILTLTPPDAFTLQVTRGGQFMVKTTTATKVRSGEETKAYTDLVVGAEVKVRGTYDGTTNTLTAMEVQITPPKLPVKQPMYGSAKKKSE